jgi:hypothetical protein
MRALSLGLYVPRWQRSDYPELKGVGLFDAWSFDPLDWKPEVPNPAFLMMDNADAFWAAKQVAAFTDDEIRAIVETGNLSDQRAADWIADCLIERRDKIAQAWFSKVLALDRFRVADGRLAFDDLRAIHGTGAPGSYDVNWSTYDNHSGVLTPLSDQRKTTQDTPVNLSVQLPEMHGHGYWVAVLESPERPRQSVQVYVWKRGELTTVVGVDRVW